MWKQNLKIRPTLIGGRQKTQDKPEMSQTRTRMHTALSVLNTK